MTKNKDICDLAEMYFGEYKNVIDVKAYDDCLVMIT